MSIKQIINYCMCHLDKLLVLMILQDNKSLLHKLYINLAPAEL